MSKHTPGPWEVDVDGEDRYIVSDHKTGRYTFAHLTRGFGLTGSVEEMDATARLIAAAPRMLELVGLVVAGNTEAADLEEIAGAILRDVEGQ